MFWTLEISFFTSPTISVNCRLPKLTRNESNDHRSSILHLPLKPRNESNDHRISYTQNSVHKTRKIGFYELPTCRVTADHAVPPDCTRLKIGGARKPRRISAVLGSDRSRSVGGGTTEEKAQRPVGIVAVVGDGSISPLKHTPWEEVMLHTAKRLKWVDETFKMVVYTDNFCHSNDILAAEKLREELQQTDILIIVAITSQESVNWIQNRSSNVPNIICFDSSKALLNKLEGMAITDEMRGGNILTNLVFGKKNEERKEMVETVEEAWDRSNSDDIRFCILVIINAYVRPVPILQNLRAKGFDTLSCMVKNCGPQILNCLLDPNCRKALQCLNKCSPVDQVCNYKCIASYESPNLEAFSLCVLQKHNCLQLDARIPEKPEVSPMGKFREVEISHDIAEDLFVGWLAELEWSWRVVAGQNPAYDQFPCQYQLFYRGKAKGSFWYEPVFQVKTLDGRIVWRRRKYRVKRGRVPGTFYFSVLDNGVVSNEFWTIVDVADDLSWGLFHYHGAARVAGQSYTGAVLVSPDGMYPSSEIGGGRLRFALEKCGIKEWELFTVDNCSCNDPPLGIPEGSSLHSKIKVGAEYSSV